MHAAKLLEVMILQCKGQIDQCIPTFVQLVLTRLTQEVKSSELRTMCLQVVIAALYYNPQLLLEILNSLQTQMQQPTAEPLVSHFIKQWIHDADCFLGIHDRKMCVLGLCTLISLGDSKPPVLNELAGQIMPALILIFDGLQRAYKARAIELEDEDSEEEEDDDNEDALSSDDDDVDENVSCYLENIKNFATKKSGDMGIEMNAEIKEVDDDSDEEDDASDEMDETPLECYLTPIDDEETESAIDEYITFHQVIMSEYRGAQSLEQLNTILFFFCRFGCTRSKLLCYSDKCTDTRAGQIIAGDYRSRRTEEGSISIKTNREEWR